MSQTDTQTITTTIEHQGHTRHSIANGRGQYEQDISYIRGATGCRCAIRKISLRLVPFVGLMFFIDFLDRMAISFAGPNGMNTNLALTVAQFGLASGIFFIGYILLEVPSNLALHRFGARKWLARIMVS